MVFHTQENCPTLYMLQEKITKLEGNGSETVTMNVAFPDKTNHPARFSTMVLNRFEGFASYILVSL